MQIIIEGPDGSGKTTLVEALLKKTQWAFISGLGPEKTFGEMSARLARYHKESSYAASYTTIPRVYDRHPSVSHPIYSQFTDVSQIEPGLIEALYEFDNLIVYCQAPDPERLGPGQNKPCDVGAHLQAITDYHPEICRLYDRWAIQRAHLIYRYWEPDALELTVAAIIDRATRKGARW